MVTTEVCRWKIDLQMGNKRRWVTSSRLIERSADLIKRRTLTHSRLHSSRLTDGFRRGTLTREALLAEKSNGKWRLSLKVTRWLGFRRESLLQWDGLITEGRKCKERLVERLERIPGWKTSSEQIKCYLDGISFPDTSFQRMEKSQRWACPQEAHNRHAKRRWTFNTTPRFGFQSESSVLDNKRSV